MKRRRGVIEWSRNFENEKSENFQLDTFSPRLMQPKTAVIRGRLVLNLGFGYLTPTGGQERKETNDGTTYVHTSWIVGHKFHPVYVATSAQNIDACVQQKRGGNTKQYKQNWTRKSLTFFKCSIFIFPGLIHRMTRQTLSSPVFQTYFHFFIPLLMKRLITTFCLEISANRRLPNGNITPLRGIKRVTFSFEILFC